MWCEAGGCGEDTFRVSLFVFRPPITRAEMICVGGTGRLERLQRRRRRSCLAMPKLVLHKCMCVNLHGRSWHLSGAAPGL